MTRKADELPATDAFPPATADDDSNAGSKVSTSEFTMLDPRVIDLWRVHHFISSAVLLALAGIGGLIAALRFPEARIGVLAGWSALAALRLWHWLWYPARSRQAWGYRVDERVLEIRSGIWFRTIRLIPLTRLQHVDLHKGPLERFFGLASIVLHTAGTHESALVLPGLDADAAVRLRDRLVEIGGDDGV